MPYEALSSCSKIRALGISLGSLALLVLLGSCKGGSDASSSGIPINTATGLSDSPFISGDGQRLYFTYSRYDYVKLWVVYFLPVLGLHYLLEAWRRGRWRAGIVFALASLVLHGATCAFWKRRTGTWL